MVINTTEESTASVRPQSTNTQDVKFALLSTWLRKLKINKTGKRLCSVAKLKFL
jgi:hypothetical protein